MLCVFQLEGDEEMDEDLGDEGERQDSPDDSQVSYLIKKRKIKKIIDI